MKFIQGKDRKQLTLFPTCLDDSLDTDNETRLIDLFVDSLDLNSHGFDMNFIDNGRPAYHPGDLLRLFIYGYLNRIRSSRALEKECRRNLELIWLLKGLVPDHNTISNFRRDNPKADKTIFVKKAIPEEYENLLRHRRYSPNTIKTYVFLFRDFRNFFPEKTVDEITEEDIRRYQDYLVTARKVSTSTQNQAINAIKFYFEKV